MVEIETTYEGELRCTATHAPSGSRIVTDAPVDNHGRGEAFSPTDLVATALATCILTTMALVADRHGIDMTGVTARVEKHMVADPVRRIGRLPVTVRFPAPIPEEQRALLERTAHTCPVHRSLDPRVEVPIVFEWGRS